tara:strand:- start:782 stop:1525 length:744 start_codon:yes stop_codon:yes gene_type:complete
MRYQSGNALFLILIAVALFAALSYAVTNSGRGGGGIDRETAQISSAQVVQYGAAIEQAILRLRLINGCQDTQISFERAPYDGSDTDYFYNNGVSDFSCHVFHPNGGGVAYTDLPAGLNDGSDYFFHSYSCISGVGTGRATSNSDTTCNSTGTTDLVLFIPSIDLQTCLSINRSAGIPDVSGEPPQDHSGAWEQSASFQHYRGIFYTGYQLSDQSGNFSFDGKNYGCFEGGGVPVADTYNMYYVVLAR